MLLEGALMIRAQKTVGPNSHDHIPHAELAAEGSGMGDREALGRTRRGTLTSVPDLAYSTVI